MFLFLLSPNERVIVRRYISNKEYVTSGKWPYFMEELPLALEFIDAETLQVFNMQEWIFSKIKTEKKQHEAAIEKFDHVMDSLSDDIDKRNSTIKKRVNWLKNYEKIPELERYFVICDGFVLSMLRFSSTDRYFSFINSEKQIVILDFQMRSIRVFDLDCHPEEINFLESHQLLFYRQYTKIGIINLQNAKVFSMADLFPNISRKFPRWARVIWTNIAMEVNPVGQLLLILHYSDYKTSRKNDNCLLLNTFDVCRSLHGNPQLRLVDTEEILIFNKICGFERFYTEIPKLLFVGYTPDEITFFSQTSSYCEEFLWISRYEKKLTGWFTYDFSFVSNGGSYLYYDTASVYRAHCSILNKTASENRYYVEYESKEERYHIMVTDRVTNISCSLGDTEWPQHRAIHAGSTCVYTDFPPIKKYNFEHLAPFKLCKILFCGLSAASNWHTFLCKGLYDPRLFLLISNFASL